MPTANRLVLEGVVQAPVQERVTPSGRQVVVFTLEYTAQAELWGQERQEELQVEITLPEPFDRRQPPRPGSKVRIEGRLIQNVWTRDGERRFGRIMVMAETLIPLPPSEERKS
ncbi:MAG: hypothetical protein COX57_07570 [Alphaproteobacteria bacterium CG_4_10_14_0_2_um_filter_63_37]|nr:MAG: hypothetical protein AUJ55_00700 [Proteobacteria bacterium CG1_02_64_396]PJA24612.1 MAG: hypothetical protein COX57_07570 [Alphaproteobacteria bacterium CG_4_10_14_0_2_um_filter_63_37]